MTVRIEHIGDAELYLGDCREILPTIDPACAVVSDPPYGVGYVRGKSGGSGFLPNGTPRNWAGIDRHASQPIVGDDGPFDPAPMLAFAEVLIWGADHYRARLPEGGRFLAWDKLGGKESWDSFSDVEFAWHSRPGASRRVVHLWKGVCSWRQGEETEKGHNVRRLHPTQKPVAVMSWSVGQLRSDPPLTILDPYMGSGTTGIAALRLGRKFVGIEVELRWFDVACRRIEAEARQGRLLYDEHADALASYTEAVRAIGDDVKAGRREVPEFFLPLPEGER